MRVEWTEYHDNGLYSEEEFHVWSDTYRGEVIGTVRSWGTTMLVVMLESGTVREIAASRVKQLK